MKRYDKEAMPLDRLSVLSVKAALGPWAEKTGLRTEAQVDSTNLRLKEEARAGLIRPPYLLAAGAQTAGRGRLGRSFVSPPGGLYMSLLIPTPEDFDPGKITILSAVAVCRAVEEETPLRPRIKWVNDIFVGGRKVSGILAEKIDQGVIVGIGVNIHTPPGGFPPEAGLAGALDAEADPARLAGRIAFHILEGTAHPGDPAILDAYRQRMFLTGQTVRFTQNGREREGLVVGVSDDGGLLVTVNGLTETLRCGEVTIGSQSLDGLE